MNRLLVPPTSFYNPNSTAVTLSQMGASNVPNSLQPSPLHQAAIMMHHHQQQQQHQAQQLAVSQAAGISNPNEKQSQSMGGLKIPGSGDNSSTATTHHFPRQLNPVSSSGFDLAAAVSAARSSQVAAALHATSVAHHAQTPHPFVTASQQTPPGMPLGLSHPPPHSPAMFGQGPHPGAAAAAALFSGHPAAAGASGIHPLLAAAASSGHFPGYHTPDGFGPMDFNMITRRKNATRETTSALKAWLSEHKKNPYPTKGEKIMLAIITKMTLTQVSTWFANARRRLKKENKMTWAHGSGNEDDDDEDADIDDDGDDDVMNDEKVNDLNELMSREAFNSGVSQLHTAQKPSQLGHHFGPGAEGLRIETNVPNPSKRSSSADIFSSAASLSLVSSSSEPTHNIANSPTSRSESELNTTRDSSVWSFGEKPNARPLQIDLSSKSKSNITTSKTQCTDSSNATKKSKIWSIADLATSPTVSNESSSRSTTCQISPASFHSPANQISPIWKSPKMGLEAFGDSYSHDSANILKIENFYGRSPSFFPGFHSNPGAMSAAINAGFHPTFSSPVSMFNFTNQTTLPKNF